jgi:hypothetical protein
MARQRSGLAPTPRPLSYPECEPNNYKHSPDVLRLVHPDKIANEGQARTHVG